jgi:predicted DNA-binding transcriptional regulator YafY
MRADRLLSLMMLLQTRGKMTAKDLAAELNVARRTILRDVEALSLAGVPIYSEGGHGGGIALDEGYRTRLTGLNTPEVQALFVASRGEALHQVGLGTAAEGVALKLLTALPLIHRPAVDHIRQRLLIDPTWWWRDADQSPAFWDDLQRAVYEDRIIEVIYEDYQGDRAERTLHPYSLVNKSSYWYLVARREGEFRTYRVSRVQRMTVRDEHFERLAEFDLPTYWSQHTASFTDTIEDYRFILRIRRSQMAFIRTLMPGRWEIRDQGSDWITVHLRIETEMMAKMLVFGLGADAQIVAPSSLAEGMRRDIEALARSPGGYGCISDDDRVHA